MEPQLPREGSALLSITGLVLTLPPLPKPLPSAIPAPTWPLWFVTGKFCSRAHGLEIMQIHFSPRCKLLQACVMLLCCVPQTPVCPMCLNCETRWQKHLQPAPHVARVGSITELYNHCYALKSSEFYRISAIFQCCDRFQGSACCTAPPHPLLRDIFLGDITNCSTCPGTGTQLHSWSSKMVLGPLANSHISGRCAFPSAKPVREQTESVGQWWRATKRPKGGISQNPSAPLLGLPITQWCWTMSKRCSLSCFTFLDELHLTLYGILALVRYSLIPKCRYYWHGTVACPSSARWILHVWWMFTQKSDLQNKTAANNILAQRDLRNINFYKSFR